MMASIDAIMTTLVDRPADYSPFAGKIRLRDDIDTDFLFGAQGRGHLPSGVITEETHETPRILVNLAEYPGFASMPDYMQKPAQRAEMILNLCSVRGHINLASARRIVDFGAGHGAPGIALAQLANMNGGTVESLESHPESARSLRQSGLVDPDRVHDGDGIRYLADSASTGRHDLIAAFMLGPDPEGVLAADLIQASRNALSQNGCLVLTSEISTIGEVFRICEEQGIRYDYIDGVPLGDNVLPHAVVIAAADLR